MVRIRAKRGGGPDSLARTDDRVVPTSPRKKKHLLFGKKKPYRSDKSNNAVQGVLRRRPFYASSAVARAAATASKSPTGTATPSTPVTPGLSSACSFEDPPSTEMPHVSVLRPNSGGGDRRLLPSSYYGSPHLSTIDGAVALTTPPAPRPRARDDSVPLRLPALPQKHQQQQQQRQRKQQELEQRARLPKAAVASLADDVTTQAPTLYDGENSTTLFSEITDNRTTVRQQRRIQQPQQRLQQRGARPTEGEATVRSDPPGSVVAVTHGPADDPGEQPILGNISNRVSGREDGKKRKEDPPCSGGAPSGAELSRGSRGGGGDRETLYSRVFGLMDKACGVPRQLDAATGEATACHSVEASSGAYQGSPNSVADTTHEWGVSPSVSDSSEDINDTPKEVAVAAPVGSPEPVGECGRCEQVPMEAKIVTESLVIRSDSNERQEAARVGDQPLHNGCNSSSGATKMQAAWLTSLRVAAGHEQEDEPETAPAGPLPLPRAGAESPARASSLAAAPPTPNQGHENFELILKETIPGAGSGSNEEKAEEVGEQRIVSHNRSPGPRESSRSISPFKKRFSAPSTALSDCKTPTRRRWLMKFRKHHPQQQEQLEKPPQEIEQRQQSPQKKRPTVSPPRRARALPSSPKLGISRRRTFGTSRRLWSGNSISPSGSSGEGGISGSKTFPELAMFGTDASTLKAGSGKEAGRQGEATVVDLESAVQTKSNEASFGEEHHEEYGGGEEEKKEETIDEPTQSRSSPGQSTKEANVSEMLPGSGEATQRTEKSEHEAVLGALAGREKNKKYKQISPSFSDGRRKSSPLQPVAEDRPLETPEEGDQIVRVPGIQYPDGFLRHLDLIGDEILDDLREEDSDCSESDSSLDEDDPVQQLVMRTMGGSAKKQVPDDDEQARASDHQPSGDHAPSETEELDRAPDPETPPSQRTRLPTPSTDDAPSDDPALDRMEEKPRNIVKKCRSLKDKLIMRITSVDSSASSSSADRGTTSGDEKSIGRNRSAPVKLLTRTFKSIQKERKTQKGGTGGNNTTPVAQTPPPEHSGTPQQPKKPLWKAVEDPKSGRMYYYHRVTRETTWKRPPEEEILVVRPAPFSAKTEKVTGSNSTQKPGPKPTVIPEEEPVDLVLGVRPTSPDKESQVLETDEETSDRSCLSPVLQKASGEFDPSVWHKKQEIIKLLQSMEPPKGSSVEKLMAEYNGREDELLSELQRMRDELPFDEPLGGVPTDSKSSSSPSAIDSSKSLKSRTMTGTTATSLFSGSRLSDKTQQIRNTASSRRVLVSAIHETESHATSISSKHDPALELAGASTTTAPANSATCSVPRRIPVPRARELVVEDLSKELGYKNEKYDMKGVVRGGPKKDISAVSDSFRPSSSRTDSPYNADIEETDTSTRDTDTFSQINDSVSALSEADIDYADRREAFETARRQALDDAISREDWDLAAALSEGMRSLKAKEVANGGLGCHGRDRCGAAEQQSPREWTQTELDRFISENDWDAVASYIAHVRIKSKEEEQLGMNSRNQQLPPLPHVGRPPSAAPAAVVALPPSSRNFTTTAACASSTVSDRQTAVSNLTSSVGGGSAAGAGRTRSQLSDASSPQKRIGARSHLQHDEIILRGDQSSSSQEVQSESTWGTSSSRSSEVYDETESYTTESNFSDDYRPSRGRYPQQKHRSSGRAGFPSSREFVC